MSLLPGIESTLFGSWKDVNVQPKSGQRDDWGNELPVCPNYQLLEIGAALAGMRDGKLDEISEFCGSTVEKVDTISPVHPLSGRRGVDYKPKTACRGIAGALEWRLQCLEEESFPDSTGKQEVMEELRETIFETCVVPAVMGEPEEKKDPHFRRIESADDLDEGEVLEKTGLFLRALKNITGGFQWTSDAQNCPQSPREDFIGKYS